MSYNSKYTGQQVEALLDQVANGNAGGGGGDITTEIDPIFSASPSAKITDGDIEEWNNKQDVISDIESIRSNASKGAQALGAIPTKVSQLENDEGYLTSHQDVSGLATKEELQGKVDKVDGKQLSTEDFTAVLKQKLEGLSNYDDTEISQAVSKLRTDLDTLVSGDTTTAIKTFNEVVAFLDGISDTEDLASIIASIEQQIAAKGTYTKPSNGIPKTDLASAVQTSLGKADTALQEEQYKGTVTSITAGEGLAGGTITGSGIISLAEKTQNGKSIDLMSKVDILKIGNTSSDTNITIDNTSYVWMDKMLNFDKFGRFDSIDGYYYYPTKVTFGEATTSLKGLMSASDKTKLNGAVTGVKINGSTKNPLNGVVDLGTISGGITTPLYPIEYHTMDDDNVSLDAGKYHMWPMPIDSLTISLRHPSNYYCPHWIFRFTSGTNGTTLTLPGGILWANGNELSISANKTYEISITDRLGVWVEFNTL